MLKHFSAKTILIVFFVVQVIFILFLSNGPKADEGIYILAGQQLLEGAPDIYSGWHNGSPYMWSIVAGFVYSHTSFLGVRIFTLLLSALILVLTYLHNLSHHNPTDAKLSLILLTGFGPFFFFSHIAVYDVLALLFFMLSVVSIQQKKSSFTLLAGLFAGMAMITKYAFIIYFPVLCIFAFLTHSHKKTLHSLLFLMATALIFFTHNFIVFEAFLPTSYDSYKSTKSGFNSLFAIGICLFILLPLGVLLFFSKWKNSGIGKKWNYFLILALATWPLFHVITGNPTSAEKHLVYAFVLISPFILPHFKYLLENFRVHTISIALILMLVQVSILEMSWSNVSPANDTLMATVTNSSKTLSNMGTYRLKFELFTSLDNVDEQIINYKDRTDEIDNYEFILWQTTSNIEMEKWITDREKDFTPILMYSDIFLGSDNFIPYGLRRSKVTLFQNLDFIAP